MEYIVQRAVKIIRESYGEPLTLDELAHTVLVSKFHFLRSFRRTTGVTPGRFLSAVRLAEAKRLLLETSLKVSDISAQVGYSSIGSFTRRFTDSVGLPPTQYRQTGATRPRAAVTTGHRNGANRGLGSVTGGIRPGSETLPDVFVGVFDSPILQGAPVASAVVPGAGRFRLTGIPAGTWYVHAATLSAESTLLDCSEPVQLGHAAHRSITLAPHPAEWFRPPVLLALPSPELSATVA